MIIPDSFQIKSKILHNSKIDLKIKANGHKIGYIKQTQINQIPQYQLINKFNNLIAIARKYVASFGYIYTIHDESNNKIGEVQVHTINKQNKALKYVIKNAQDKILARSQRLNQSQQNVEIIDNYQIKIGEIRVKNGLMKTTWQVSILGYFDRRLLIFIPLFSSNK